MKTIRFYSPYICQLLIGLNTNLFDSVNLVDGPFHKRAISFCAVYQVVNWYVIKKMKPHRLGIRLRAALRN